MIAVIHIDVDQHLNADPYRKGPLRRQK
jgi:hypothetical protein